MFSNTVTVTLFWVRLELFGWLFKITCPTYNSNQNMPRGSGIGYDINWTLQSKGQGISNRRMCFFSYYSQLFSRHMLIHIGTIDTIYLHLRTFIISSLNIIMVCLYKSQLLWYWLAIADHSYKVIFNIENISPAWCLI